MQGNVTGEFKHGNDMIYLTLEGSPGGKSRGRELLKVKEPRGNLLRAHWNPYAWSREPGEGAENEEPGVKVSPNEGVRRRPWEMERDLMARNAQKQQWHVHALRSAGSKQCLPCNFLWRRLFVRGHQLSVRARKWGQSLGTGPWDRVVRS